MEGERRRSAVGSRLPLVGLAPLVGRNTPLVAANADEVHSGRDFGYDGATMRGAFDRLTLALPAIVSVLAMVGAEGCVDNEQSAAPAALREIPADEFVDIARSLSDGLVSGDALATVLRRASPEQGSNLIKYAALPRSSSRAEALALLGRIWNGKADDIPIATHPIFLVSVASTLHRLEPAQCSGCYEYARGLLSSNDRDVRSAAALEMGELGSPDDIVTLQQMIVLDDFDVAGGAAAALSGIAEADSIPILQGLMNDTAVSADKREMLAQVIKGVENRRAIVESLRAR